MSKYTVVGIYPDNLQHCVDTVDASTPEEAASQFEIQMAGAKAACVFEGEHDDKLARDPLMTS